jgi:hypothetical protein
LWIVTVAFATTAPEGSVTVPEIEDAFPDCAHPAAPNASQPSSTIRSALANLILYFSLYECGPGDILHRQRIIKVDRKHEPSPQRQVLGDQFAVGE